MLTASVDCLLLAIVFFLGAYWASTKIKRGQEHTAERDAKIEVALVILGLGYAIVSFSLAFLALVARFG